MARKLALYAAIAPNRGDQEHYFFTDVQAFIGEFSNFKKYEIDFPNYRINSNLVVIKEEAIASLTIQEAKRITYVIDYDLATGYMTAYHVSSGWNESNKLFFRVELDNWASYISKAEFGHLHLTRSNLYGNNRGLYDEAMAADELLTYEYNRLAGTYTPAQVSIVFLLAYNVSQSLFHNEAISRTEMFAVSLQQCIDACSLTGLNKDTLTAVEMGLDIIGGVYGVASSTGDNDAEVLKAWIVPTSWIEYGDVVLTSLKVKSLFTGGNGNTISNVRQVIPCFKEQFYNLNEFNDFKYNYPNCVPLFGPKFNGFKVTRRLPSYSDKRFIVHQRVTIGQDDVQVVLNMGENEHDVSQNFEVRLTTANNVANPLQAIARDISFGLGAARSAVTGYGGGGRGGAALGLIGSFASSVKQVGVNKVNGSGDGFATWNDGAVRDQDHLIKRPYFFMYYITLADEKARAVLYGVSYDIFFDGLEDLENAYNNRHYVADSSLRRGAFVKIDDINIMGIPSEAIKYIKDELARGVYYAFIDA